MLINVRSGVIDTNLPDAIGFSVDIAQVVESATGIPVGVWQTLYGRPLGTVAWSVTVDSFADLATMNQKLAEDATYLEKSGAAQDMFISGSFEDGLTNVVHTAGDQGAMGYVSALSAIGLGGKTAEVMAFGVGIADYVNSVTGNSVSFCVDQFAEIGRVTWVGAYADAAAVDAAQQALAADSGYLERTSAVGDLFLPGSGTNILSQRIN
jgi:hypothetical protein